MGPYGTHDADAVVAAKPPAVLFSRAAGCGEKLGGGFSKCAESDLANEGACSRYMLRGRVNEPESPHEGACLRYMMNRNRHMSGRV